MPTYTSKFRATSALATMQVTAPGVGLNPINRDIAIGAIIAAVQASTGPTGREVRVRTCDFTGMTGPTAMYSGAYTVLGPITGSTFNAVSYEDAVRQHIAAGPTGPHSNLEIWSAS